MLVIPYLGMAQVGNPAPDFTVTDVNGNTHHLYDYLEAGKVVVLDFYYTTCGPCQFYSPQVNLAYSKYGCNTANVVFLSIDYNDTDAEVEAYDNEYAIEFPSISGLEGGGNAVVSDYQIIGFPTFFVIDSSRTIIDQIDPPTLQVFDFRFAMHGITPASCTTSLADDASWNASISVFPNPLGENDYLHITSPENFRGKTNFAIYDYTGKILQTGSVQGNAGQTTAVNLNKIPPGIYAIQFSSDQMAYPLSKTFVVK